MLIRELFVSDVTRDIPPIVYFHEQTPENLASEVSEYIITGGWPHDHPHHRRVAEGIHEQYVKLLTRIAAELDKTGGPELPTAWISGFYGSGKSSFAKLLGLALDGVVLPDGRSLAQAWLERDTSRRAAELRQAWTELVATIEPVAVVFDIGSTARDNEHIHTAAVRQVQKRLGYCTTEPLVADFELRLERDGQWQRFEEAARKALDRPWSELRKRQFAGDDFSLVLARLFPDRYPEPQAWIAARSGTEARSFSPGDAVEAIGDMLRFRRPGATLFLVIDEVSQYVLANQDRVDRLRAFATALGSLGGKVWLVALGQQRLEEADNSLLFGVRDRFPPGLRVHLAATNIRDVVHQRLLRKKPEAAAILRELFEKNRPALKLYAYGCESVTADEFAEMYPMLPGHIDLLLHITSALGARCARAQRDDQAIRGLLQLLGELFRDRQLADMELGALVALDQIYEVQYTALDSDVQTSMARIVSRYADDASGVEVRSAKAVALLELIQDTIPTDARLVAQCLYDRVDAGNNLSAVTDALEQLRRENLLGYSEKHGYKIQSSAGEEWERERRDIAVPREMKSELVQESLKRLLATADRPRLEGRPIPWAGVFSDGRRADNVILLEARDAASLRVDFRLVARDERKDGTWVRQSADSALRNRLTWVIGDSEEVDLVATELWRSRSMVRKYKPRVESLNAARKLLLQQEEHRTEDLDKRLRDTVAAGWMGGMMYFRGRPMSPREPAGTFARALKSAANRILPDLFPHFVATRIQPSELLQLVEAELSGPSPKFLNDRLGLLELDSGRYVSTCAGVVPRRVQEHVEAGGVVGGTALLTHFGGPPYGYSSNVVKACVAGLVRAGKLRIQPETGAEITAMRDAGARAIFEKDRAFRRATLFPAGHDDIGFQARARICKFFEEQLQHQMEREDNAIADAVALHFPIQAARLGEVFSRLRQLAGGEERPEELVELDGILERCVASSRQTTATVKLVVKHLDALRDGVQALAIIDAELAPEVVEAVRAARDIRDTQAAQLREAGALDGESARAASRIGEQLDRARPWRDIAAVKQDVAHLRTAYATERQRLLEWQEKTAEQARARIKARDGFNRLTDDQRHNVLRPLSLAVTTTSAHELTPSLVALNDRFVLALSRAEDEANQRLDAILGEGEYPLIVPVDLALRNREIASVEELRALLDEIEKRLLKHLPNARVRLI
ncbi:MAG: BREX system P-loop protein BrxC [Proteobacteria bacterium]|nr:BREX system P-loop protein BrxC [Pseudomonadota bacterium]